MRLLGPLLLSVTTLLFVSGCGSSPVADDIGQREANQIVSLLREHGISAQVTKARGAKGRYSVSVSDERYVDAAGILTRIGLPADKKASFEDLTATNGIIPASREVEALRLDRATAAEIESLLQARADISGVSVIVRARSSEGRSPPSATVVIQKRPEATIELEDVREIAARAVPGIKPEDIFVSLSDSPASGPVSQTESTPNDPDLVSFLGVSHVPAKEYQKHVFLFIALTLFVGSLAGLTGYLVGQFTQLNRQGASDPQRGTGGVRGRTAEPERSSVAQDDSFDGGVG
jgi:type III secretory pathway lipoprotein EscJ